MATYPKFAMTESALKASISILKAHNSSRTNRNVAGRIRGVQGESAFQLDEEYAVLRLVSIVEAFLDALSYAIVSKHFAKSLPIPLELLAEWEINSTSSWTKRTEAYKNLHGVSLKNMACHAEVQAAIQVRNCIAHGLGRLTARQRSSSTLARDLATIDVHVGGGRIRISSSTVETLAKVVACFIRDVDAAMA